MSIQALDTKALRARASLAAIWLVRRDFLAHEPWTVERRLHMLLAGIAIMGWALAYTALMRGLDVSRDTAHSESAPTKVSVNLPSQAPEMAQPAPAAR